MKKLLLSLVLFVGCFTQNALPMTDLCGNSMYKKSNHKHNYVNKKLGEFFSWCWETFYDTVEPSCTNTCTYFKELKDHGYNAAVAVKNGELGAALKEGILTIRDAVAIYLAICYLRYCATKHWPTFYKMFIVNKNNSTTTTKILSMVPLFTYNEQITAWFQIGDWASRFLNYLFNSDNPVKPNLCPLDRDILNMLFEGCTVNGTTWTIKK